MMTLFIVTVIMLLMIKMILMMMMIAKEIVMIVIISLVNQHSQTFSYRGISFRFYITSSKHKQQNFYYGQYYTAIKTFNESPLLPASCG